MKSNKNQFKSSYSLPVRIVTIALSALVASGALVYLVMLLINLFGGGSAIETHIH